MNTISTEQLQNLANLVNSFGSNNEQLKALKRVCEADNNEIKDIMAQEQLTTFNTDEFQASYVVKESTKVNEDKLLQVLREDWFSRHGDERCPYIKVKEYVDIDILEDLIYRGNFTSDMLTKIEACATVTKTPTLTVKKKGKK